MAASYLRDVVSAVDHLHTVEIMHRDIKVGLFFFIFPHNECIMPAEIWSVFIWWPVSVFVGMNVFVCVRECVLFFRQLLFVFRFFREFSLTLLLWYRHYSSAGIHSTILVFRDKPVFC